MIKVKCLEQCLARSKSARDKAVAITTITQKSEIFFLVMAYLVFSPPGVSVICSYIYEVSDPSPSQVKLYLNNNNSLLLCFPLDTQSD